jgi:hypothetical protein
MKMLLAIALITVGAMQAIASPSPCEIDLRPGPGEAHRSEKIEQKNMEKLMRQEATIKAAEKKLKQLQKQASRQRAAEARAKKAAERSKQPVLIAGLIKAINSERFRG